MACSGQTAVDGVDTVWDKLATITDVSWARTTIINAIKEMAKVQKVDILPIFLSDQIVKDILKVRLLPTPVTDYHSLMEGITIFKFLQKERATKRMNEWRKMKKDEDERRSSNKSM